MGCLSFSFTTEPPPAQGFVPPTPRASHPGHHTCEYNDLITCHDDDTMQMLNFKHLP